MLLLLPPSETKRPGGDGAPLALDSLVLPSLRPQRDATVAALVALSADEDEAARVLKLSVRQRGEIAVNAALRVAPTMPAVDRYTGVLFDALAAGTLDAAARTWLGAHAMIHSAPFGPVGALDPIPAYRLAANASVPALGPLRRLWAAAVTEALATLPHPFIVDLRSEAYVGLGPVPASVPSVYVRVVTEGADGAVRALNHFNKATKGRLVRALAQLRTDPADPPALAATLRAAGWCVEETEGEWRVFA